MAPPQRGLPHGGGKAALPRQSSGPADWLSAAPSVRGVLHVAGLCLQCLTLMAVLWIVMGFDAGGAAPHGSAAASRRDFGFDGTHTPGGGAAAGAPTHAVRAQDGPPPPAPAPGPGPGAAAEAAPPARAAPEWCRSDHKVGNMTVHTIDRCHLAPGAAAAPAAGLCSNEGDAARPAVVITVVALSNDSFGIIRDHGLIGKGPRGLDGFLGMLAEQDYPACRLSLGLLVSSNDFFKPAVESIARFVQERGMARGVVIHKTLEVGIDPAKRHTLAAQRQRRGTLARLRNAALSVALGLEDAVFWVDSDISNMPAHTLSTLVGSGKDVVTTITKGWDEVNYDLNAWTLPRKPYDPAQGADFVPESVKGVAKFSTDFENGPDAFVPIDSVGGCTTLVRADVHREGALFAPYFVIGAAWHKDGYDGVESEGFCYVAKYLGRSCWLAAHIVTHHQSYWIGPPSR